MTADSRATASSAFLAFWRDEGETHFQIEEQVLLPSLRPADAAEEAIARVLHEHEEIRSRARALDDEEEPSADELQALGAALERHIRYEERVLFALVERSFDDDRLTALGEALARAEDRARHS